MFNLKSNSIFFNTMKYAGYLIVTVFVLLMVSFAPIGKRKKPTLPPKAVGHVQWIQAVSYHAVTDSTGTIYKGDIISDTDKVIRYDASSNRRQTVTEPPIEVWNYDTYGDQIENDKHHADGTLYNKITRVYYPDGDIKEIVDSGNNTAEKVWEYIYRYDNSSRLLDSTEYYRSGSDAPLYSRVKKMYDSAGKQRQELYFSHDTTTPTGVLTYSYNDKKQLVETNKNTIENGNSNNLTPVEKNDFWYDKKGRMYDMATYHYHQGLIKNMKITFDTAGRTTDTYNYAGENVLTGSTEKRVFKASNTTQEDVYDADGILTDYTISHDSAKHIMDRGVFHISYHTFMGADRRTHNTGPAGDTVMVRHIVNDNHFNTIIDDHFSKDGKVISQTSYQYTYDSIGNWTEKIDYNKDNKPVKVIERQIGYFQD
jgi:hypothetical protein